MSLLWKAANPVREKEQDNAIEHSASAHATSSVSQGRQQQGSLQRDAIVVDAVVSTVGFPLVGGPAGTMEGGRQADVVRHVLRQTVALLVLPICHLLTACRSVQMGVKFHVVRSSTRQLHRSSLQPLSRVWSAPSLK